MSSTYKAIRQSVKSRNTRKAEIIYTHTRPVSFSSLNLAREEAKYLLRSSEETVYIIKDRETVETWVLSKDYRPKCLSEI